MMLLIQKAYSANTYRNKCVSDVNLLALCDKP